MTKHLTIVLLSLISMTCLHAGEKKKAVDLEYKYKAVPAKDNAYAILWKACEGLTKDRDELKELIEKEWDSKKAEAILKRQRQALDGWAEAKRRPKLQAREVARHLDKVPHLSRWLDMARLLSLKARIEAVEGTSDDALARACEIVRLGALQERNATCHIGSYAGFKIKSVGAERALQLIKDYRVTASELIKAVALLSEFSADGSAFKNGLLNELKTLKIIVRDVHNGTLDKETKDFVFGGDMPLLELAKDASDADKKATIRLIEDVFRTHVKNCDTNYHLRQPTKTQELGRVAPFGPNYIGRSLRNFICHYYDKSVVELDRDKVILGITRLQLALAAFSSDNNGKLPKKLENLVPKYIKALPTDPFSRTNKPLRYSPGKQVLYSVGTDGFDGGGMEVKIRTRIPRKIWKEKDPSFPIVSLNH